MPELFNSDAGQVAIRKHIIESDYLEAVVALPTNMFYNTGIPTFIWIITNRKPEHKKGKVQLINATSERYYSKMKKSLGDKQNEMTAKHIENIVTLFLDYVQEGDALVLDNKDFGYTEITIEKPKRIEELLKDEKFNKIANKEKIIERLSALEATPQEFLSREDFIAYLGVKLTKSEMKLLIDSNKTNNVEKIPLKIDIQSYYDKEVKPYVLNSWIDWESKSVGYEILFNKYFYTYTPPRELHEINQELQALEEEIKDLLYKITE